MDKSAFTLAETLITLAIIGVVAALTIPNLIQNHNEKVWNTAADVFQKKLEVAARSMNTQEVLAGYKSTKDFINELKKHIKITKICDKNELTKCFPEKVFWGPEHEEIQTAEVVSAKHFGLDWGTEVVGVEFANGVEALIAYDPNCVQDPYNNQIQASNCMAVLYDTSARKNPNTYGKDLRAKNIQSLVGNMCFFKLDGQCYSAPFTIGSSLSYEECQEMVDSGKYGDFLCRTGSTHGNYNVPMLAAKVCGHLDNIFNVYDMEKLMSYLYTGRDKFEYQYAYGGVQLNEERLNEIGLSVGDKVVASEPVNNDYYSRVKTFNKTSIDGYSSWTYGFADGYLFCRTEE